MSSPADLRPTAQQIHDDAAGRVADLAVTDPSGAKRAVDQARANLQTLRAAADHGTREFIDGLVLNLDHLLSGRPSAAVTTAAKPANTPSQAAKKFVITLIVGGVLVGGYYGLKALNRPSGCTEAGSSQVFPLLKSGEGLSYSKAYRLAADGGIYTVAEVTGFTDEATTAVWFTVNEGKGSTYAVGAVTELVSKVPRAERYAPLSADGFDDVQDCL